MRIRSIKPEFWASDDVASLHWYERLLFIGLWSYVDDNGAGRDRVASIAASLFSGDLEHDHEEVYNRVRKGLQTLEERGLVHRFECCEKQWLYIANWRRHQKIGNPSKSMRSHLPIELQDPTDHTRLSKSASAHESLTSGKRAASKSLSGTSAKPSRTSDPGYRDDLTGEGAVEATFEPIDATPVENTDLTGDSSPAHEPLTSDNHTPTSTLPTGTEEPRNRGTEDASSSDAADAASDDDLDDLDLTQDDRLLATLLLQLMIENGDAPRPSSVSKAWLIAANRLHRIDGRDPAAARGILRWAKQDEFWAPNIKSLPTFRQKYDQLAAAAKAKTGGSARRTRLGDQLRGGRAAAGGDQ